MKIFKRLISLLLACMMMISVIVSSALTVKAEDYKAYFHYKYSSDLEYFTDPKEAWQKAKDVIGATFGLLADWDGGRCVVPPGADLTIELNGHMMTRNKADSDNDGEVIYVGKGATVRIFGGSESAPEGAAGTKHVAKAYVAKPDKEDFSRENVTFYGGLIHGGNSSNGGGGIHIKSNARVYLSYVTVAGNRAEQTWGSDGYGGGIMMAGSNSSLYMDHSTVSYNYAYNDGGGIHVHDEAERCTIEMVRSHIDHNIADDNGGGINVEAEHFRLLGDAVQVMNPEDITDWDAEELGSSVSYNYLCDSDWYAGGGGGLYLWNDYASVEGINFVGNDADDDGDGGGVFIREENVTIRNCNLIRNRADTLGGGINNYNDNNTIDSCTIYGNYADDGGGAGGGVYTECTNNISLSGSTIIRGNSSKSYGDDNMYLPGAVSSWTNAYIIPSLTNGADVHIRTGATHDKNVSVYGTFRDDFYSYDNSSSEYIAWDRENRNLHIKNGTKPETEAQTFVPDSGSTTQNVAGGYTVNGENYQLIKGVAEFIANANTERDFSTVFYYSDGYFMGDTMEYNQHLATMSVVLNCATGYSNDGGWGSEDELYTDKSNNFRQLMSDIGVKDEDIYLNDFYVVKPSAFSIGLGLASKKTESGDTLVIASVRSMGYESEWVSNVTLSTEDEAYGFADAASKVFAELKAYLERKGIDGSDEHTKFWVTGYSRGGATANLTGKRIVDAFDNEGKRTYVYPVAPPKGGLESEKTAGNNYNCIHNTLNRNDIVPFVGPGEMGFIRYGVDHFIPGTVTSEAANTPYTVGSSGYNNAVEGMIGQLAAVSPDAVFDDYFHPATINYITGAALSNFGWKMIEETDDHKWSVEEFIPLFIEKLQEYALDYGGSKGYRETYAGVKVANGRTFEQAVAAAVKLVFAKSAEETAGIAACFASLMDRLDMSDLAKVYVAVRRDDSVIPGDPDFLSRIIGSAIWNDTRALIWKKLTVLSDDDRAAGYHAISEYMTAEELQELSSSFDALLIPVIELLCQDYEDYDQDVLGTLAYNVGNILINHFQEVMLAWTRSYDSFYENDRAIVTMDASVKTAPSPVSMKVEHADGTAQTVSGSAVTVRLDDKITFVPENDSAKDTGEAIYYRFTTLTRPDTQWHAVSGPLTVKDIYARYSQDRQITVDVFSSHYSMFSETRTFTLILSSEGIIEAPKWVSSLGVYEWEENEVPAGSSLTIHAIHPEKSGLDLDVDFDVYRFKGWKVYQILEDGSISGTPVEPEDYAAYFGSAFDPSAEETAAANLTGNGWRFEPEYTYIIPGITAEIKGEGQYVDVRFDRFGVKDEEISIDAPVSWTAGPQDEYGHHYHGVVTISNPEGTLFPTEGMIVKWNTDLTVPHSYLSAGQLSGSGEKATLQIDIAFIDEDYQFIKNNFVHVQAVDSYSGNTLKTIQFSCVRGNKTRATLQAPEIAGMEFTGWNAHVFTQDGEEASLEELLEDGYYPWNERIGLYYSGSNEWIFTADYRPAVSEITVGMNTALTPGSAMPKLTSIYADVTSDGASGIDRWTIENAQLTWDNDGSADYDTVYTAHVTMDTDSLRGINWSDEYKQVYINGRFGFAKDMDVIVQLANLTRVKAVVTQKEENGVISLDLIFPSTRKQKLVSADPVEISVPHGASSEEILSALPETVSAYAENGLPVSAGVKWTETETADETDPDGQLIHAYGEAVSALYDTADVRIQADVSVLAEPKTPAPSVSTESGSYTGILNISFEAEEGAEIYYARPAAIEGKEYPDLENAVFSQYSEPVVLNNYEETQYITVYAVRDGMRESDRITYTYRLTKPEVRTLEAKPATITENGNIDCVYSEKTVIHYNKETGEPEETETVPDQYYADDSCTVLLSWKDDVVIPSFVKTSHKASEDDAVALMLEEGSETVFGGLDLIGFQAIGNDGGQARVLGVMDARIPEAASDYGFLFGSSAEELTYDSAEYRFSAKDTENTLYSGEYVYVSARTGRSFLLPGTGARLYVKPQNSGECIYSDTVTVGELISHTEETDQASDNITVDDGPRFATRSLLLSGQIGVNFYMDLESLNETQKNESYMEFTVSGRKQKVMFNKEQMNRSKTYYGFTCRISSVQMADEIVAVYHYKDADGTEKTIRRTSEAETYLNAFSEESGEKLYDLIKAVNDYGYHAQQFLSVYAKTPWTIGVEHEGMSTVHTESYDFSAEDLAPYAIEKQLNETDLKAVTYSMTLDTDTAVNLYVTPAEGYTGDISAVIVNEDGTETPLEVTPSSGRYRITIAGISAHLLGKMYSVKITTESGGSAVKVSGLSYAYASMGENDPARNVMCALYDYYLKSIAYSGSLN